MANYNIVLVILSYVVAVVGSMMALLMMREALRQTTNQRGGLIFLSALCLGGVGIWSMHFIGMLAYEMPGMAMSYNWLLTALSLIVGVGVVYIGLIIMGLGEFGFFKLTLAGIIVGLGVAAMHYTGMLAMLIQADMQWDSTVVALSIGIAVAAAIVALWLAVHVQRFWQIIMSALIMGIAVCGMHYTGMAAVTFVHSATQPYIPPMNLSTSIFSLIITGVDCVIVVLSMIVVMAKINQRRADLSKISILPQ